MAKDILKTTITVTVLHYKDVDIQNMDPEHVLREIDEGSSIGDWKVVSTQPVPEDKLHDELLTVGNDGSFFDI